MAQKRMFDRNITNDDDFQELPLSAQCLYFHINMNADDDGLIKSYRSIMRSIGATDKDLLVLIKKSFIYKFDSNVLAIKHWKINNTIRSDRYRPTIYTEEFKQLTFGENNEYLLVDTNGIPTGNQMDTQNSIVENSIEKISKEEKRKDENSEEYLLCLDAQDCIPYEEIINYLNLRTNHNYKSNVNKTRTLIHARWNEGFRLEDFKIVIDKKSVEWLKTEYEKFLRPETLFGPKFEGYLNQPNIAQNYTTSDLARFIDWSEYINE
jgi:uncharacterized phage protein (TIGR02220 family)